jgi:hypothetical protein
VWDKAIEAERKLSVQAATKDSQAARESVTFVLTENWFGVEYGYLESEDEYLLDRLEVLSNRYTT